MGPKWERLSLLMAMVQGEPPQAGSCRTFAKWARAVASAWRASANPEGTAGHQRGLGAPVLPSSLSSPRQAPSPAAPVTSAGHSDTQHPFNTASGNDVTVAAVTSPLPIVTTQCPQFGTAGLVCADRDRGNVWLSGEHRGRDSCEG